MTSLPDLVTWLQERTALSILSQEALAAIAPNLQERTVPAQQAIAREGTAPAGLFVLRSGRLESQSTRSRAVGLLPGTVLNWQALILGRPASSTATCLSECHFWFVEAARFQALVARHPEIAQAFSEQLADAVEELSSRLNFERERQAVLRPYLVSRVQRGIVGRSRYAVRLRAQIKTAAENRGPTLIFGEPGLEKDNIAALIHFSSLFRREPIVKLNCSLLQANGAELFGRSGGKLGILEALGEGTLVLNNLQELPPTLFPPLMELLRSGTYAPRSLSGQPPTEQKTCQARIVAIAEKAFSDLEPLVENLIKVPPLRVRKADLAEQVNYYLSSICRRQGLKKPSLTPEALRRLQAYDFPNNLRELESLVERATIQLQGCSEITEEILWPAQSKKTRFRFNLFNAYPELRHFLRSQWWPDRMNYGFTAAAFALVVAVLFLGPQTRSQNFALNLFWAWWWPLVLMGFPLVGRLWCAICPFMIYGEIIQKLSLWLFPRPLKKWPRPAAEKWGGWFLFGLFALILLWEELWNLTDTAYLSAWLLLLITGGAVLFSLIFERRFWCRYLCPIGGMNGMFAKLSVTELRAQQGTCSAECTTYQCYKGGPQKGEGMETDGCPLYSHPAQLEDNRDCVLCMTCLKACPHRSVQLNLRPPGIELWTTHLPRPYEVALLFLLLGAVFLHHLDEIPGELGLALDLNPFWTHLALAVAALSLPATAPWIAQGTIRTLCQARPALKPRPWVSLAYGYLPLVLAGNLAHYLPLGLGEAGTILPVTLATFGVSGEGLPILVAHPAAIAFLQGTVLVTGMLLSAILTQKIAKQPLTLLIPQHSCTLLLGIGLWRIIL